MMADDTIRELAREHGWTAAAYADAYEVLLDEKDIPEPENILIPWWAEHNSALYVGEYQEGFKNYITENYYTASQAM